MIELTRCRARNLYLTLLFNHPLSPLAQSLDALWLGTTHTLITAYRQAVAAAESEALAQSQVAVPQGPAGGGGGGGGGGKRRAGQGQGQNQIQQQQQAVQVELRKRLTRFRQALLSEEEFYRHLISRIVRFYSLQPLTKASLAEVGIGSGIHNDDEQREGDEEEGLAPIGEAERKEKVKLVYKGLICLGDLERYKEQYSEKFRREGKESRAGRKEEMYGRAKVYYDVARSLIHDDGELQEPSCTPHRLSDVRSQADHQALHIISSPLSRLTPPTTSRLCTTTSERWRSSRLSRVSRISLTSSCGNCMRGGMR